MKNINATHPLQSNQWGEFRKKTGIKVINGGNFQLTIHKVPNTPWNIGYLPKGNMPDKTLTEALKKIGKEEKCIFIQLEPNIPKGQISNFKSQISDLKLKPSAHPLFTNYTFVLDLTKSEDEILANMHNKTRYNIKVAQKHGVEIKEDNSNNAFREYLKLTRETTKRQNFYSHDEKYHKSMWEALKNNKIGKDRLSAHLFLARYKSKILAAWILFVFKNTLYYPYGASSNEYRNTMASNLMMWEIIRFGKNLGLSKLDMWGALGPEPNPKDPWYGFHKFKQGYGAELIELIGSYDLVINPVLYRLYVIADKIRWIILGFKK